MLKATSRKKVRSMKRGKNPKPKSRSVGKPLIFLILIAVVALGTAYYLQHEPATKSDDSEPSTKQFLNTHFLTNPAGWSKGNSIAKTVLVEFGDFQCGACAAASSRLSRITKKHGSRLKVIFKQYPMQKSHGNSMLAAQAAEAAGQQLRFWEMHDLLFERQRDWAEIPDAHALFLKYAEELRLDLGRFKRDLRDNTVRKKIYRDMMEGQLAQVTSVPTFFLNGKRIPNSRDETEFEQKIVNAIRSDQ